MKVQLLPEARRDLKEAKAFYRHRSPLAAVAFAQAIDTAVARIAEAPLRYPIGEHDTREHVLAWRFPYTVVYRLHDDVIIVVAVAHHSRQAGYWQNRT